VEGTIIFMEAHEVCAKQISTKLHDIHFQYNLLEPGHGTNPKIHSLWNPTPINMEWFRKYIIEKKHIWTCIPVIALFKT